MTTTTTKTTNRSLCKAVLAAVVLAAGLSGLPAKPAHAETIFTVNNTSDPGNGVCNATGCTLREAINAANATPGADVIRFNIPGGGVKIIKPISELPKITERVTINGYSQPGSSPNTLAKGTDAKIMVEIDGATAETNNGTDSLSNLAGLQIQASNTVVKGLSIHSFLGDGIEIEGDAELTGVKVEGNFIGTTSGGTFGRGGYGVSIQPPRSGDGPKGNTVGGSTPAARNLISDNLGTGVSLFNSDDNVVSGNLIGTKKDGTSPLGNSLDGVAISGGSNNTVGGTSAGEANTVAFNGKDGVAITPDFRNATVNRVLRNSISSNGGIGIDLGGPARSGDSLDLDGPTANDPKDPDTGPNNLQNKPVISSAKTGGGKTTIQGTLNSTPNKTFRIQFFSKPFSADPDAEGKDFAGEKFVSTDASGNATFTFQPASAVAVGSAVTATATIDGNTSEFSAPKSVVQGLIIVEPSPLPPNLEPTPNS